MEIRALTSSDAEAIASWRYPGPYSTYDFDEPPGLSGDTHAVTDVEELIGYCCFGAPARVGGAEEQPGTLDTTPSACGSTSSSGTSAPGKSRRATALSLTRSWRAMTARFSSWFARRAIERLNRQGLG